MPTAYCLGIHEKEWRRIRVNAYFTEGEGQLLCKGLVGNDIFVTMQAVVMALRDVANILDIPESLFSERDLHVHIDAASTPVVGASYGLALCMAIFAAATKQPIPSNLIFTGCIGPAGEVMSVDRIEDKRTAAYNLGYTCIMLPAAQLDMYNKKIDQIPVQSIYQAISILFDPVRFNAV